MKKPWLEHYPDGVPAEIDPGMYRSVVALLDQSFIKYRDRVAYTCMGRQLKFGELDAMSGAMAAWLQAQGLKAGDRVAIMLPNILQFPVALAAVMRAGCVVVAVNPLYTPRELEHQLNDASVRAIIILENFASTLEQVISRTFIEKVVVASAGDLLGLAKGALVNFTVRKIARLVPRYTLARQVRFNTVLKEGKSLPLKPSGAQPDDIAILQYTGGTTGVSKGAMLQHRTLVANMLASEAWMQPGLRRKEVAGQYNIVCALPLYHVFALVSCALLGMRTGANNLLIPNPRDLGRMIDALKPYKLHVFPAVNTLYRALLDHPRFASLDFSELLIANGGGMAVQSTVASDWLRATGVPIVEGYGLSETSAGVTCNRTDATAFTATIGLPLPSVDVRIVGDDGVDVVQGAAGEIAIKGPQVMAGYWQNAAETAKAFTADGWFKSGDIGIMDQRGYITIVDRKKDMILISGFNVYPSEIEAVVALHPGVLECVVIGVPDEKAGEAVKLFVVKHDAALGEAELLKHCALLLTAYKRPKYIEFRDALPKSNVGKILRRELRHPGVHAHTPS